MAPFAVASTIAVPRPTNRANPRGRRTCHPCSCADQTSMLPCSSTTCPAPPQRPSNPLASRSRHALSASPSSSRAPLATTIRWPSSTRFPTRPSPRKPASAAHCRMITCSPPAPACLHSGADPTPALASSAPWQAPPQPQANANPASTPWRIHLLQVRAALPSQAGRRFHSPPPKPTAPANALESRFSPFFTKERIRLMILPGIGKHLFCLPSDA